MSKIVLENFNEGNGYYKVNLAYLSKEQVEEIEELVSKWKPSDEDIKSCIGMCLTDANEQRFKNYGTNLKDCLAWLEKQGEQKSTTIDVDKMVSDYASHNEKRNEIFGKPVPCMVRAYKQGICDTLESLGEEKPFEKEFTFKAIPRLLDMIEPSDRAKAYCQKLIDTLAKEEYNTDAKIVEGVLKGWNGEDVPMAVMDEKQGEQKPSTEVKPKFHEGDWISGYYTNYKVMAINSKGYEVEDTDGNKINILFENEKFHHLFTIADAKDGDVLASELCGSIILFRGIKDNNVDFYCDYDFSKIDIPGDRFSINDGQHYGDVEDSKDFHPATKEQRDTLLKAMTDAGWEFDFEKKELKKIDDNEVNGEDYGIDGLWHARKILEKTLGSVEDYQSDDGILDHKAAITAVKKLYKQKPAEWSEEDERRINRISDFIWKNRKGDTDEIYQQEQDVNWLKSLRPQKQWKPSDEQIEALGVATDICSIPEKQYNELNKLYYELKKLKGE